MEGLIGATLTGLMILLFLHDWRSVIVVVFNIPMALLGSLFVTVDLGSATINIMTLGGLALVDRHAGGRSHGLDRKHPRANGTHTNSLSRSDGARQQRDGRASAVGNAVHSLSVFIPAFIMAEPVRSLFVPLSLAVGFSMITLLTCSPAPLVPVLSRVAAEASWPCSGA